jgi:isoleucyl-tRNA synthetase
VYSLVYQASQNEYLIMARERVFDICTDMQHTLDISIPEFCLGSDLVGCQYESLSFDESSEPLLRPVLLANFVTSSSGSGLVHVAPDYGTEDFELCRSFGIAPNETDFMDDSGNFTSAAPKFLVGMNILSGGASECILEVLKCSGSVLSSNYHTHRYPYDWRTGKPVIQRATRQWFASISSILPELLASLENVQFIPDSGKDKMAAMLRGRSDWCISRQRHWGVPIPALFDGDNELSLDPQVIRHVAELVRKDPSGSDIWWKLPIDDLIPSSRRDHLLYRKSFDTLDVWFDSGTVWSNFPDKVADLYLEGSDQYRGWFQSSLITSGKA